MDRMTGARSGEPYVGLRAYDVDDQHRFFGRRRESHEVASLWLGNRLLVLHGSSGVGKTSLIQAGVRPVVGSEAEILPVGRVSRGSAFPTAALREHNPYTFALLSSWSPWDLPTRLTGLSVTGFLSRRPERTDRYGDSLPLLVAIDRFEELFNDFAYRWRYRDEFIEGLAAALEELPHLRLLISIRENWLAALLPYEKLLTRQSRARFRLLPLDHDAALEAVTAPLEPTTRFFGPGVADELVTSLRRIRRTSHIGETTEVLADRLEPVQLQVVCSSLWRQLPADVQEITAEHLHDYADVDRTLAEFCAAAIAEVAADHDVSEAELREWLERTFVTELGTRGTVYEGLSATGGMPNEIARALEDRHILRAEQRSGSRWYELQHDRLIGPIQQIHRPWPVPGEEPPAEVNAADYLRAAESALADGELALAEKHAEEALEVSAGTDVRTEAETESFLGNIAVSRERPDKAERHYRRAAELFETLEDRTAVGRLLAALGSLLFDRGHYAAAVEEWQAAVARLPGDLAVQIELANALSHSGQPRAAIAVYTTVLNLAPESAEALAGRGQLLADSDPRQAPSALQDLDLLAALHPDHARHPQIRSARALALAGAGRAAAAGEDIEAALAEAPDSGVVLLRAARIARLAGDEQRARELAARALAAHRPALPADRLAEARRLAGEPPGGQDSP
jgi:tetratricopeptide (TPR) repeat protein